MTRAQINRLIRVYGMSEPRARTLAPIIYQGGHNG